MLKKCIPLFILLCSFAFINAQDSAKLPTAVLANEYTTVSLFFPSTIAKVIAPAVNYKFDYERGSTMGLLKARKGNPSNLTVITEDGYIYSFSLKYSENIENYNYIMTDAYAVGKTKVSSRPTIINENPDNDAVNQPKDSVVDTPVKQDETLQKPIEKQGNGEDENTSKDNDTDVSPTNTVDAAPIGLEEGDLYDKDRKEYYRIFCENNYLQRTKFKRSFRQNKRIVIKLNNILVDRNEIYFVMQIENNSKKEYLVNGLSFFLKKNRAEPQKIIQPLYQFNLQEIIDPESVNEVVYVFEKFQLTNKEEVFVVLDESENNRMVLLPLDSKQINAPTN